MTCGLVHASYSLPEWQAVKLTFWAPNQAYDFYKKNYYFVVTKEQKLGARGHRALLEHSLDEGFQPFVKMLLINKWINI